jgi:hypothetical protein
MIGVRDFVYGVSMSRAAESKTEDSLQAELQLYIISASSNVRELHCAVQRLLCSSIQRFQSSLSIL